MRIYVVLFVVVHIIIYTDEPRILFRGGTKFHDTKLS